jgi:hypothetical protein
MPRDLNRAEHLDKVLVLQPRSDADLLQDLILDCLTRSMPTSEQLHCDICRLGLGGEAVCSAKRVGRGTAAERRQGHIHIQVLGVQREIGHASRRPDSQASSISCGVWFSGVLFREQGFVSSWSGAGANGPFTGAATLGPAGESLSTLTYTDGNGTAWRFFRQELPGSAPAPGVGYQIS